MSGQEEGLLRRPGAGNGNDATSFEVAESDYRYAAKDIKEGLQHMMPAARTRANAVYYGFIVLSLGLIVTIVILLHESQEWRKLVREEGELWRGLTKEIVHDIGFT